MKTSSLIMLVSIFIGLFVGMGLYGAAAGTTAFFLFSYLDSIDARLERQANVEQKEKGEMA